MYSTLSYGQCCANLAFFIESIEGSQLTTMSDVSFSAFVMTMDEIFSLVPKLSGFGNLGQELLESLSKVLAIHNDLENVKNLSRRWHENLNTLVKDLQEALSDVIEDTQPRGIIFLIKNLLKLDSTVEDELKAITRNIELLYEFRMMYMVAERYEDRARTMTGCVSGELKLFGREREFEKVLHLLEMPRYEENGFEFISIVGMGGIGKSTLAQHVYHDDKVASFPLKAWCCVSMNFNLCHVYRDIIKQITGKCHIHDLSNLQEEIQRELMGKKFLIILDDYWSESMHDFDTFCVPFMGAQPGSMFIVTTRNRTVAKQFTPENRIIDLGFMSNEDSWSLLCSPLILSSRSILEISSFSNLDTIGKEICNRCEGLPLALVVMRGILLGIDDEAGWKIVLDDLVFGKIHKVHSVLRRSYENLPSQLIRCFSFCTIFPEHHLFERERTVDLWVAAGIIECDDESRKDENGGKCFDELVSRALLSRKLNGLYVMHGMVRAMAKRVVEETYATWEKKAGSWDMIRHVFISVEAAEYLKSVPKRILQLRTLMIDGANYIKNDDMGDILVNLRHLRVLDISGFRIIRISKCLGDLRQLRKLRIHDFHELKTMPSIIKLGKLQELDINQCSSLIGPLFSEIGGLVRLKKLSISHCSSLIGQIPSELGALTGLTKLHITGCGGLTGPIPPELGALTGLISLYIKECGGLSGPIPPEIGRITGLMELHIAGCEGLTGPIPPELGALTKLKKFVIWRCQGLTGSIPLEVRRLTGLTKFFIDMPNV